MVKRKDNALLSLRGKWRLALTSSTCRAIWVLWKLQDFEAPREFKLSFRDNVTCVLVPFIHYACPWLSLACCLRLKSHQACKSSGSKHTAYCTFHLINWGSGLCWFWLQGKMFLCTLYGHTLWAVKIRCKKVTLFKESWSELLKRWKKRGAKMEGEEGVGDGVVE